MSEISKEEYLKLVDTIEKLYGIIWDNQIITPSLVDYAVRIYNEAEIRTFNEIENRQGKNGKKF